ncbi:MAG: LysR family transcriptional regulator [Oscillospiraceae bacterium]|nr:LysR family transcriptional regulator [Oscillospiraceae bacterium]
MELLQLRYFYECARSGSIAKTADKYMVPASSVSASIRRLETELKCKLFDRSANRITLNVQGEQFLSSVEKMFAELDTAVADISSPTKKEKIKLLVRSARSRVTDAVIEYRNSHPDVTFELNINFHNADYNNYDIIISVPDNRFTGYSSFMFADCPVCLQVGEGHPLIGKELTLKQLKHQPFVTMGGNLEQILVDACEKAGFTPNIVARVNDIDCYSKLVKSGLAIGHIRVPQNRAQKSTHLLNVTDLNERQRIYVYYKEGQPEGNIHNFIEYLMAKCY